MSALSDQAILARCEVSHPLAEIFGQGLPFAKTLVGRARNMRHEQCQIGKSAHRPDCEDENVEREHRRSVSRTGKQSKSRGLSPSRAPLVGV